MQAQVHVRVCAGGKWLPAILTTDRAESSYGLPIVVVEGEGFARHPAEVQAVRVRHDCPIDLADAAVQAGFYVIGQPRGREVSP